MNAFLNDIEGIRRRAREQISEGAVTSGYQADRACVIGVLNEDFDSVPTRRAKRTR